MGLPAKVVSRVVRNKLRGSGQEELAEQRGSSLFQKLELEAFRKGITPRTKESREWFRQRAQRLTRVNRQALMREDELTRVNKTIAGNMYMFFYDPKTKDKLPYYDQFPLIFVIGPAEGGFYGLNIHYLPPVLRAQLLDELLRYLNNDAYDETTRLKMSYRLLNSTRKLSLFKPCFKHYLTKQVKGQFAQVPVAEWEIATFLPTAQWTKADANKIFSDSRKIWKGTL